MQQINRLLSSKPRHCLFVVIANYQRQMKCLLVKKFLGIKITVAFWNNGVLAYQHCQIVLSLLIGFITKIRSKLKNLCAPYAKPPLKRILFQLLFRKNGSCFENSPFASDRNNFRNEIRFENCDNETKLLSIFKSEILSSIIAADRLLNIDYPKRLPVAGYSTVTGDWKSASDLSPPVNVFKTPRLHIFLLAFKTTIYLCLDNVRLFIYLFILNQQNCSFKTIKFKQIN